MRQDRSLLEQNLIKPTLIIKRKRNVVKEIKYHLSEKHSILDGSIQSWINNPAKELQSIDNRLLFLFAEQIYLKTGDTNINPEDFFTKSEIKTARQYSGKLYIEEEFEFPYTVKAGEYNHETWHFFITIQDLIDMLKSRKLHYNFNVQRAPSYTKVGGEIVEEATLVMKNVLEMKNLLKEDNLVATDLTFNAAVGTSDVGEEILFDKSSGELTITEGTKLDILDGWHRTKAAEMALAENPVVGEFKFGVKLLNLTDDRARKHLAQISKGTPQSKVRIRELGGETYADQIIKELSTKSELKGRISKKEGLSKLREELVTYNTLLSSIEKNFNLERKVDMFNCSDYLREFFDVLIGTYQEEFVEKYIETKEKSLINDNNMFAGYILLASQMQKANIDARYVIKYVKEIDFNRDNKMWQEQGVLDEKGRLTRKAKLGIEKLFNDVDV
ncbi:DNA sulfur modification protein DndB [Bacillus sp. SCS-151]|uniref:DNA sulfur modification protein DndB n=1 Tax=Nanhaiella sioensis TaxID=3115293 RepID=UPI00397BCF6E